MKAIRPQIFIHIIGCLIFLSLPFIFSHDVPGIFTSIKNPLFQQNLIGYLLLVAFFYLNYYLLIPFLYFGQKYLSYLLIILTSYALISFVPHLIIKLIDIELVTRYTLIKILQEPFFEFLVVFILSFTLKINERLKLSEQEKINAELSYLKAQINPHFLFNTLNSIYSLAIEKSDYTATAVVKLSGMMRYVITEANQKFVSLEKEINYIRDYIDLQKLRIDPNVNLFFELSGDVEQKKIAPLILISFIENAFKYGINTEENSEIKINIDVTKNYLHFRVRNNKVNTQQLHIQKSGVGIENTAGRLQLLYPGRHKLRVTNHSEYFAILLSIQLS
ncbi:MAG: sensor histidine kinase [Bacteroidetes bacterium]|nr:sensor histidine kinase [Bacteroidota bacterium]